MCGGDDDDDDDNYDCWLPVIIASTATSLLSHQMMGHLCHTGATGIAGPFLTCLLITPSGHGMSRSCTKKEESESMLPNRGSSVCLPVTYFAAVVLQQTKHTKSQEKHEKLSNSSETHFRP